MIYTMMMIKLIIRKIMTEELAQSIRCLLQAWGPEIRFGTKVNTGHTSVTKALGRGSRGRLLPRANQPTNQGALCSSIVGSNRERGLRAGIVTHTCSPAQEAKAQKSRSLGVWASLVYIESTTLQRETLCLKKSWKEMNEGRKESNIYLCPIHQVHEHPNSPIHTCKSNKIPWWTRIETHARHKRVTIRCHSAGNPLWPGGSNQAGVKESAVHEPWDRCQGHLPNGTMMGQVML